MGHPRVEPVPAVRREQAGELLVLEQRRDRRVIDALQLPRARRLHLQAGPAEGAEQLRRRIRVQRRSGKGRPHGVEHRLHLHRAMIANRARPEQLAEHGVVHLGAPRKAREAHLGRDQRTRGLGGQQQADPGGIVGAGDGGPLQDELDDRPVVRLVVDFEERRAATTGLRRWLIPSVAGGPGEGGCCGER